MYIDLGATGSISESTTELLIGENNDVTAAGSVLHITSADDFHFSCT